MRNKVLLSGYYGFDNAGDEAVLYAIVESLRAVGLTEITVLSNNPAQTAAQLGVQAVNRWGKRELFRAIKNCDLFISGGGSLLQDVSSKNGILYYLGLIALARLMRKPVLIYAQGIGPVQYERNRRLCAFILNRTQNITVRDNDSARALLDMGVQKMITTAADPVLGIDGDKIDAQVGREILRRAGWREDGGPTLLIALRPWQGMEWYLRETAFCGDHFSARGWQVVFLPMHFGEDEAVGQKTAALMHQKSLVLAENYSPMETMAIIKSCDLVLGMRLHALIMAAVLGKPLAAISYDPKIDSFMANIGEKGCYHVDIIDSVLMIHALETSWEARGTVSPKRQEYLKLAANWARSTAETAAQLLR